jgi:hypothetical protein
MARKEKQYHFIYKTTNLLSGRYYIGMHSTNNLEDGYLGSGTRLSRAIKKHGKTNFNREILEFCESRDELKKREEEVVTLSEIAKKECMNLVVGGSGSFYIINENGLNNKANQCKKGGEAHGNRLKNDSDYREIHRLRVSNLAKNTHKDGKIVIPDWTGKIHSNETKVKMSKIKSGTGVGETNSQYGTCWITKDNNNKKIKKDDLPNWENEGWVKGRK